METTTLAYVAGLFDGEGSIVIGVSKPSIRNKQKSPSHWLQVGITNTSKELIVWLKDSFGGHISDNSHSPSRKKQRPCWAWRVNSHEACKFLKSILPFLKVKKKQAELAIEFQESAKNMNGRENKSQQEKEKEIEKRNWYKKEISSLSLGFRTL
jgi:hypothetical protein